MSKGGFVFNAISTTGSLTRGDGLIFSNYTKDNLLTSGIIEGQFGLNYYPHPAVRVGLGWEYLWLVNVGSAVGNLTQDFNRDSRPNNNDSTLYTGWYVGGEIKY
jgi:hypothetical protein